MIWANESVVDIIKILYYIVVSKCSTDDISDGLYKNFYCKTK